MPKTSATKLLATSSERPRIGKPKAQEPLLLPLPLPLPPPHRKGKPTSGRKEAQKTSKPSSKDLRNFEERNETRKPPPDKRQHDDIEQDSDEDQPRKRVRTRKLRPQERPFDKIRLALRLYQTKANQKQRAKAAEVRGRKDGEEYVLLLFLLSFQADCQGSVTCNLRSIRIGLYRARRGDSSADNGSLFRYTRGAQRGSDLKGHLGRR